METSTKSENQMASPIKNLVAKSINGQEPSWKNVLTRKFAGMDAVATQLEQTGELEPPLLGLVV